MAGGRLADCFSFENSARFCSFSGCISTSVDATASTLFRTGLMNLGYDPPIALISANLAEKEAGPSASLSAGSGFLVGALDRASASVFDFPGTHLAVKAYHCIFSRRRRRRGLSSLSSE